MTLMTVVTMICRGSLKVGGIRSAAESLDDVVADGAEMKEGQGLRTWLAILTAVLAPLGLEAAKQSRKRGTSLEFRRARGVLATPAPNGPGFLPVATII